MDDNRAPAATGTVDDRVRELGFDPRQLTPREREELVEIYRLWPDEAPVISAR